MFTRLVIACVKIVEERLAWKTQEINRVILENEVLRAENALLRRRVFPSSPCPMLTDNVLRDEWVAYRG